MLPKSGFSNIKEAESFSAEQNHTNNKNAFAVKNDSESVFFVEFLEINFSNSVFYVFFSRVLRLCRNFVRRLSEERDFCI